MAEERASANQAGHDDRPLSSTSSKDPSALSTTWGGSCRQSDRFAVYPKG